MALTPALPFIACPGIAFAAAATKQADAPETTSLPSLHQPVEILLDHWGVPHIYAKNEADLFFAQGFNAARDRLFQIDLWRRRGLGRLSEVFGPSFVEQDRATRLFLYRGYEVVEITHAQLFDRDAMTQHFYRIGRFLVGKESARKIKDVFMLLFRGRAW
jgi:penicillin amidase